MKKPIRLLSALAVAVALTATGCGGDDEETTSDGATGATGGSDVAAIPSTTGSPRPTRSAPAGMRRSMSRRPPSSPTASPTQQEAAQFVEETVVPSLQQQEAQISALTTSGGQ